MQQPMPQQHSRRWRIFTRVVVPLTLAATLFASLFILRAPDEEGFSAGNVLLLALVNLNIVFICILTFIIGRNLLKLVFDRRRGIVGSALRIRLVTAFVMLTLVPTVIVFLLASGLLSSVMEGWFSSPVESSVKASVEVARFAFNNLKRQVTAACDDVTALLELRKSISAQDLQSLLERERRKRELFSLRVIDGEAKLIAAAQNAAAMIENFEEPALDRSALHSALNSETSVLVRERDGGQFIEVYQPLALNGENRVLVGVERVDSELLDSLNLVNSSFKEFQQLRLFRSGLRSGYLLTLGMITGSILFAAIWSGFYIARALAVPLQELAEGTRRVAAGDYNVQITSGGDDEIGQLVTSFNQMTSDLKHSTEIAEKRRVFVETVLGNLAVGVIALDRERRVTSVNAAAARLFDMSAPEKQLGQNVSQILKAADFEQLEELILKLEQTPGAEADQLLEKQITVVSAGGRELKVVCTMGRITDQLGAPLGMLLLFDDITELAKAQSMAVWREVARRIAHEIKNPLTPIQLAAQRLQKLLGGSEFDQTVTESAQIIVENVDSIKRLANEFSNFARMPTAEFQPGNLNVLISDTISPYAENHSEIVFQFVADNKMPDIRMDREQIRRVVINLLENAIDAVSREGSGSGRETPRIVMKTYYDRKSKKVSFEVADNGPGITGADKVRVFEPYYTTKNKGTGLGLAIVTSVVADHQGDVRVYDNSPRGAKFMVELPLAPRDVTQRRLASA
ncbi:MAG: HAMP domain-containing protein [Oligoflexia bacterium]|nr:HAMP domain-containing protein [Oligoflexia bacterium]